MSAHPDVQFSCIGCGALNPPGAETCVGCGHRFAGPGPQHPLPVSDEAKVAELSASQDETYYIPDTPASTSGTSIARQLARVLGWIVVIVITAIASIIAFFTACFAVGSAANNIGAGMVAGTVAAAAIVIGITMIGRYVFKNSSDPGRGNPR
jgi:hypothetical protein